MRRKVVLVTGATGQVGKELLRSAPSWALVTPASRTELDLVDPDRVRAVVATVGPDWIINAAAYTAVDRAETERALARAVNCEGARSLAVAAAECGARLVQLSTDFVFAGEAGRPRRPDDRAEPRSVYGRSKLDGERAVVDVLGTDALIVRTAWVYAGHGQNFVKTILRLLGERSEIGVVADQIGTPTWARGLAVALWEMIGVDLSGVHHWTDAGVASWYDFAVAIQEEARALGLVTGGARLSPISTAEFPTPAARPGFSVLDKTATWSALGRTADHWRCALRAMLREASEGRLHDEDGSASLIPSSDDGSSP